MKYVIGLIIAIIVSGSAFAEPTYLKVVAQDGSGDYLTIQEAVNSVLVYQEQRSVIKVKPGIYREKLVIPAAWCNISLIGDDPVNTIISYDDNANKNNMGTFSSYTVLVHGDGIRLENLTIENASQMQGQAVALHLEGTESVIINCRLLGNQDTVFTGNKYGRFYFYNTYIEGTTDFIFGPATCWFEHCVIHIKADSYITAASTPASHPFGYIFNECKLTGKDDLKVYLGRPWREAAYTLFMNCYLGKHIRPEGWHNWGNPQNEQTARYLEYNNRGEGADISRRVSWAKVLTRDEADRIKIDVVFPDLKEWNSYYTGK